MIHPKKYPRRCRRFTAYFGQNWDNVVAAGIFPVLKVLNFFSRTFIILYMRLKLRSLSLLDPQNMPKPIPHCSNFIKIIFLKKGPSDNLSTNKYLMSRPHVGLLHWNLSCSFTFIILLTRRGVWQWHYCLTSLATCFYKHLQMKICQIRQKINWIAGKIKQL